MMLPTAPPIDPCCETTRTLARALDGDDAALRELAETGVSDARLLPALALEAKRHGLATPLSWRSALHRATVSWMGHEATVERLALDLTRLGVPWVPIKGWDLADRFYEAREARPMADVDLLIPRESFERVRHGLEIKGWEPVFRGERADRYLREEGYCWPIVRPDTGLAELHLRLWGMVPKGLEATLLEQARPHPKGGFRISPSHAWLLSAVHAWLTPTPRGLLPFWDLEQIARTEPTRVQPERLAEIARGWDLQLPALLSAQVAAALWGHSSHRRLARILSSELRLPERRVAKTVRVDGESIGLSEIVLARLLSGRRSRAGWRSVGRRLWAHPGVVERETRADRSFWQRRVQHVLKGAGLTTHAPGEEVL